MNSPKAPTTRVATVVICTYNRPLLLPKSVASCLRQDGIDDFEIIIVDNSRDGNAAAAVGEMARSDSRVRYVAATTPNISVARNAGIAAASGNVIAFIDDDMEVAPDWLRHLLATLEASAADCVYGPVIPRFEGGRPPAWDAEGWYFARAASVPSGTPYQEAIRGPKNRAWLGTGNSAFRSSTCLVSPEPFDPAFGRIGAEDTKFFDGVIERGGKIVWCADAEAFEWVPRERQSLDFQLDRYFHFCRLQRQMQRPGERGLAKSISRGVISAARMAVWGPVSLLSGRHSERGVRARFGFVRGFAGVWGGTLRPRYGEGDRAAASANEAGHK